MAKQLEIQLVSKPESTENSFIAFFSTGAHSLYSAEDKAVAQGLPEVFFTKSASNPKDTVRGLALNGAAIIALNTDSVKHWSPKEKLKVLASTALRNAEKDNASNLVLPLGNVKAGDLGPIFEGLLISAYQFTDYKSECDSQSVLVSVVIPEAEIESAKKVLEEARIVNDGINIARDFVNRPGGDAYPDFIAQVAKKIADETGLVSEILTKKELEAGNYNGILTVGRGSNREPRLIILHHKPEKPSKLKLALVGKAVAFDTGGYCIKGAKGMWEMKGDMAGGAAVLGAMKVIALLRPDIEISAYIPSVINAVGPDAYLPGDIIRSRSGQTVHVDNTDAEGRLILMDALDKAQEDGATHIIDAATLTGSVVAALGNALTGIFGNDDELVDLITYAGAEVGENYWRLPLVDEYRDELSHPVADMDNVGKTGKAGSIIAALFLEKFVKPEVKWAHLDIAGTFLLNKDWKYYSEGATGVGVRTFIETVKRLNDS